MASTSPSRPNRGAGTMPATSTRVRRPTDRPASTRPAPATGTGRGVGAATDRRIGRPRHRPVPAQNGEMKMVTQDDQPMAPWLSVADARTRPEMLSA